MATLATLCVLALLALPTFAYAATWMSAYPFGTIHTPPSIVSVDVFGTAKLNASTAKMTVGGVSLKTFVTNVGPARGHWEPTETLDPVTGVWTIRWTWVPDTGGSTKATIYCYPPVLTEGTRAVTVAVKDVNGNLLTYGWSFTLGSAPTFGAPLPAAGSRVQNPTPVISIPVSDNTGVTSVSATVNGNPSVATLLAGKVTVTGFTLATDGPVTVAVTASDAAGNTSTRTWTFTLSYYANLSCHAAACHGTTYDTDNAMGPDCVSCHIDVSHAAVHDASPAPQIITISGVSFGMHECSECHTPMNLINLHDNVCATCHPTPKDTVAGIWAEGCVQGGCHTVTSSAPMHASIDASHTYPADKASCLAAGCHDASGTKPFVGKSLADLHATATTTVAGDTRTSCEICHSVGVTPTSDCLSSGCHPERALPHGFDPVKHTAAPSSPETGTWPYVDTAPYYDGIYFNEPYVYSVVCSDCHDLQIATEHAKPTASSAAAGCANCHPTPADPLMGIWDKSCAQGGCHTVAGTTKHESLTAAHATAQSHIDEGCGFVSSSGRQPCHYSDIVQEHNRTITKTFDGVNQTTKTLSVTCTECHSSAAFAALGMNWDGTCNGCHNGTTLENHTIVGTARYDAVYAKHGAVGSNTMDSHGWIHTNPGGVGANEVGGCGTHFCHSNAWRGGGWPSPDDAKYCYQCHEYDEYPPATPATHQGTPTPSTYTISGVSFGPFPCSDCHDTDLGPEHAKPDAFDSGDLTVCEKCHPGPRNTFIAWDKTTCVQGGCHSLASSAPMHASIDASHTYPADKASCLAAGCHNAGATVPFEGRSIADIHSSATTTVAGDTRTSCEICHSVGVTPTSDCLSSGCHPERALPHGYEAATHTGNPTAQSIAINGTSYGPYACSDCHDVELGPEHAKASSSSAAAQCGVCHPSPRDTLTPWDKTTCAQGGCHTVSSSAPMHAQATSAHLRPTGTSYDDCFISGCHTGGADLAAIHAPKLGCATCHGSGTTPTADCAASGCHVPGNEHAGLDAAHTSTGGTDFVTAGLGGANHDLSDGWYGASCLECHIANLMTLHGDQCATCHSPTARVPVPTVVASGVTACTACHPSQHTGDNGNHTYMLAPDTCDCHDDDPDNGDPALITCTWAGCHPGP